MFLLIKIPEVYFVLPLQPWQLAQENKDFLMSGATLDHDSLKVVSQTIRSINASYYYLVITETSAYSGNPGTGMDGLEKNKLPAVRNKHKKWGSSGLEIAPLQGRRLAHRNGINEPHYSRRENLAI